MNRLHLILGIATVLLSSCIDESSTTTKLRIQVDSLQNRLEGIEIKVDALLAKDYSLQKKVSSKNTKQKQKLLPTYETVQDHTPAKKTIVSTSWECQAITKKGTRCKRAARSEGYCWQHGG